LVTGLKTIYLRIVHKKQAAGQFALPAAFTASVAVLVKKCRAFVGRGMCGNQLI
jgi:hypothetical protein